MTAALHIAPTPYHLVEGVNFSTLRHMRRSPLHYRHACDNERPDSDTFRRGRLVHTLVLEPERLERDYAVWGGRRAGKLWTAFKETHAGKTIVTIGQLAAARQMAAAVLRIWAPDQQRESTITWIDPTTGLRCKARIDSHNPGCVTDLKTTRDVALGQMERTLHSLDIHLQLAHYRMGLRAITGRTDIAARIVAVEATEPHDAAVFEVDEEALIAGEVEVTNLLKRVAECRESGTWPGRYAEPQTLSLPGWVSAADDDDLTGLGLDFPTEATSDNDEENEEV